MCYLCRARLVSSLRRLIQCILCAQTWNTFHFFCFKNENSCRSTLRNKNIWERTVPEFKTRSNFLRLINVGQLLRYINYHSYLIFTLYAIWNHVGCMMYITSTRILEIVLFLLVMNKSCMNLIKILIYLVTSME